MSFFDCVADAVDEGSIDKGRGERAQALWKDLSDRYERQGHPRHVAEGMAAEDVKASFKKEAGDVRHVALSKMAFMRKAQAEVSAAKAPDMVAEMERMDYRHRGLVRRFQGRLAEFLGEHHRDILGRVKNPAGLADIVRELHGEASGNATAKAMADGIRSTLDEMRLMFNEAGGIIPKLDNWGLPHSHSRSAISRAGFEQWFAETAPRIDWTKIDDRLTGKPFQGEGPPPSLEIQRTFMKEIFDNIAYGRNSKEAVYGRPKGTATYKKHAEHRVLAFKSADDWMAYNKAFGTGDAFKTLMGHVHRMARDITLMREFGPNPGLGIEYKAQLWDKTARDKDMVGLAEKAAADARRAIRMFKVMSGGPLAESPMMDWIATFMSSTRNVLTSALLDRAVVASMSDLNTMRLAAQSIGMNPANIVARQIGALKSLSRDELLRAQWVADTMADAGTALARFQQDVAPAEIAEWLSSAAMKMQGLAQWTDRARATFYQEMSGYLASHAGKELAELDAPLRGLLERHMVTAEDWAAFMDDATLFRADNGATFAMPMYWRAETSLPSRRADEIFFKIQGAVEEQMEIAVPTGSLYARSFVDPAAYDLPPGSLLYELAKSGTMFKSFAMTFTVNQHRQIMTRGGYLSKGGALYGLNLAAGATVMGSIAVQINELLLGRDPQDMTNPMFWARSAMKGGAFGIVGDIVTTGQASWGGGFPAYVAGPMPQFAGDVWNLTIKNAFEYAAGGDANFAAELARFGKRYTPMGQTIAVGPAIDRLWWDQLQLLLDPESADALASAAKNRANLYGSGEFWESGSPLPSRAPSLENAIGR